MTFLMFLSGFIWNLILMVLEAPSMSYDVGMICMVKKKFLWQIDEMEILEQLDKGTPYEDED